jgi:hypothetical protein
MVEGYQKSKDYHMQQISNVKLFGVQRKETAKSLQFLELMKTMFDCGGNTIQCSYQRVWGVMKEIHWTKKG